MLRWRVLTTILYKERRNTLRVVGLHFAQRLGSYNIHQLVQLAYIRPKTNIVSLRVPTRS